jgi:hypothetical protein
MNRSRNSVGFKPTAKLRRPIALLVAFTSLNLSLVSFPGVFAAPRSSAAVATGVIRAAGTVTVDGARATSGQTIFPGSHVVTSEESESIIDLEKFTRLMLSEKTEFTLDFSRTSISSWLGNGVVRAFIPAGLPVSIKTVGADLITDPSQPGGVRRSGGL